MNYEAIKKLAKEEKCSVGDLIVLSRANDPFYTGTKADWEWGAWFAGLWERFAYVSGVHLRRIHYQIVSQVEVVLMPDKTPYVNTDRCWNKLVQASKCARYLGLVNASHFTDQRNKEAVSFRGGFLEVELQVSNDLWLHSFDLPEFPDLPDYQLSGYKADQRYHLEIWCEKSTMNDVLGPICSRYGATLQVGTGEMSITRIADLCDRLEEASKPARIFYISDFDPAGRSMPVAVSRKIEFFVHQKELDLDVKLFPVALTEEQVRAYALPRTPIKGSERRKAGFEERFGSGATELDALEALHPGELEKILRHEVEKYYDTSLESRVAQVQLELKDELSLLREDVLADYERQIEALEQEYEEIRYAQAVRLASHADALADLWKLISSDLDAIQPDLADYNLPEAVITDESLYASLLDTSRDYMLQLEAYKQFQGK